jgi:hypothetical protein
LGGGLESGLPDTGYIGSAYQLTGGRLISDVPRGIKDVAPQRYPTLISPSEGRKAKGDAGQLAIENLAGAGNRQVRFDTPDGVRVVDWVTIEGDTTFAHESSLAERPIYGNQQKLGEVAKDAWLMQNMEGYQPEWHFWQGRLLVAS